MSLMSVMYHNFIFQSLHDYSTKRRQLYVITSNGIINALKLGCLDQDKIIIRTCSKENQKERRAPQNKALPSKETYKSYI